MTTPPDATRRGHINTLIAGLDADGDWSALDWAVCLAAHDVVGGVSQAGRLNMKNPAKLLTAVNSPVFSALGVVGDGATSYLVAPERADFSGANFTQNSAMQGIWCNQQSATVGAVIHCGNQNGAAIYKIHPGPTTAAYRINDNASLSYLTASRVGGRIVVRDGASSRRVFLDGVEVATSSTASTAGQADVMTIARQGTNYGNDRMTFYLTGGGGSAGAATRIHARVATFLTAIGA